MTWRCLLAYILGRKKLRYLLAVICVILYLYTTLIRLMMFGGIEKIEDRTLKTSKDIHLGFSQMSNDELQWIPQDPETVERFGEWNTSLGRKYIIIFRHYEQLGRATSNLLALCAIAKHGERNVVAPFVNNSRMAGLPYGVGHHFRKKRIISFSPFQTYFDVKQVNELLKSNGYSTLTSFHEMEKNCNRRLDVVVHFLYHKRKSIEDAMSWYRISELELQNIYSSARQNDGWTNCPYIKKSNIAQQLGEFKISRYLCIDPEIIRTVESLENKVLRGANCVGIVQWKGVGRDRSHFELSRTSVLRPSDLRHNAQLIDLARSFVKTSGLGKSFISIHVRAERHIFRKGDNITQQCFKKLAARVQKLREKHNWNVYLACDIVDHGSDTLIHDVSKRKRLALYRELMKLLHFPKTLSRIKGLYDAGAAAIIEMHILAEGKKLVTLGGGNYQEWLVQLFTRNVRDLRHSLYRVCEMR